MIITVTSQKGGVGKTTTAVSLAALLAKTRACTLLDLDPQGHCAISLGFDPAPGVYAWFSGHDTFQNLVFAAREGGPYLLRGNSKTKLVQPPTLLRARLIAATQQQDPESEGCLVIDTPAYGEMQEAAIAAADHVVIPVRCGLLSVDGVLATVALMQKLNPNVAYTLLPLGVDKRVGEHRIILAQLRQLYSEHVAETIPARVAVDEAVALGKTIWEHNHPGMAVVREGYQALAERLELP